MVGGLALLELNVGGDMCHCFEVFGEVVPMGRDFTECLAYVAQSFQD